MKVGKGEDRAPFRLRPTLFRLRLTSHHFLLTSPPSLPSPSYRSSTTLQVCAHVRQLLVSQTQSAAIRRPLPLPLLPSFASPAEFRYSPDSLPDSP